MIKNLDVSLFDGLFEPYFRFSDINQWVMGGTGTDVDLLISPGQRRIIGLRSSHKFKNFFNIEKSISVEIEDNTQLLYPFRRLTSRSSLIVPIIRDLKLVFRGNSSRINYLKPDQNDINFLSLGADLVYDIKKTRFFFGANREISIYGDNERSLISAQSGVSRKIRQWTIDASLKMTWEEYVRGETSIPWEREGILFKLGISRKF